MDGIYYYEVLMAKQAIKLSNPHHDEEKRNV